MLGADGALEGVGEGAIVELGLETAGSKIVGADDSAAWGAIFAKIDCTLEGAALGLVNDAFDNSGKGSTDGAIVKRAVD